MRIEFYLPTIQQNGSPINPDTLQEWRGIVTGFMVRTWGGCSSHAVSGDWLDTEGRLHSEESRVIYSFGAMTPERATDLRELAACASVVLNQAAIMVAIDGVADFVTQRLQSDGLTA